MSAALQATPSLRRHGKPLQILVVDDDPDIRDLMVEALSAYGLNVRTAENASAARKILEQKAMIDAVVTDVRMPGPIDGVDLACWLYQHRPDTLLVLTSGYFDPAQANDVPLIHGHVLPKPFRPSRVAEIILDWAGRREPERRRQ